MSKEQLAVQEKPAFPQASTALALHLGLEPSMMIETIKAQCFKGKRPDEITDAQLAAFVSVCSTLDLNPLIPGFCYAYPERNGGITPIVGPDGTMKKLDEHIAAKKLTGYTCKVFPEDVTQPPTHATATIHRTGSEIAAEYTAIFKEWCVQSNPNWQSRPRHMIWIRALKQAARQVIHGLPMDNDEYKLEQMLNVTPDAEAPAVVAAESRPRVSRKANAAAPVAENPKPAEQAPIEVAATPAPEKKVEPTPAPEPAAEEAPPVQEAAPEPKKTEPVVTELKDGEKREFKGCTVVEFVAKDFRPNPTQGKPMLFIKAKITGPFQSEVFDAAVKAKDEKDLSKGLMYSDAWQTEKPINLTVVGAKRPNGTVGVKVEAVELAQEEIP